MKSANGLRRAAMVCGLGLALAAAGFAEDDNPGSAGGSRSARLSSVDGAVQVIQGGELLSDNALVNTPLFEGTEITTGDDGRAEIQFDDGSIARIPPDSSVTLAVLKPGDAEIDLNSGMGYFELQGGAQGRTRVRFDGSLLAPNGFTVLRVKLDEGAGELAVFSGNVHMDATSGASLDLRGGESVSLNNYNVAESIEPDSWDAWNSDRDQVVTTAEAATTPPVEGANSNNNAAWGELSQNGTWYNLPDQGQVWSPYDASDPGWDPYGNGYWVYTPSRGYVWVSGYAWGYVPFQCGTWNWYDSFGWGWLPGMCEYWGGYGGVFTYYGGGGYGGGGGFNIGYAPVWYRLPMRPHPPRPRNPAPEQRDKGIVVKMHPVGPAPVIPVVRRMPGSTIDLPSREPDHPVTIGRVIAQPVRPVAPREGDFNRQMYGHHDMPMRPMPVQPTQGMNPGGSNQTGNNRPVYRPAPGGPVPAPVGGPQRPGYTPMPQPGGHSPAGYYPGSNPGGGSRPAPSGGGGGYHPAPTPAPHPSGGGGGGSHPAPSGGGSHPAPSSGGGSHPSSSSPKK